jgi:DNA-binding response OmpR family regulator
MSKTILIIDDELDLLDIISDYIEISDLDINILKAQTVSEAKALMRSADLVLSDINMPDRDELELLLKNCGKPLARITGNLETVGEFVITKPFGSKALMKVVKELMARTVS